MKLDILETKIAEQDALITTLEPIYADSCARKAELRKQMKSLDGTAVEGLLDEYQAQLQRSRPYVDAVRKRAELADAWEQLHRQLRTQTNHQA